MQHSPHRRWNLLQRKWVLVSPHRNQRPWQGETAPPAKVGRPAHDPNCYLCPGAVRANGETNPQYEGVFVFPNDFPALFDSIRESNDGQDGLFRSEPATGECRVICYSPRHDLTMAELSVPEILAVIEEWKRQDAELRLRWKHVQIFENKGEMMGCSNPHPHGQIWASDFIPTYAQVESDSQEEYFAAHGSALLDDVLVQEIQAGERLVCQNDDWAVIVPFWAEWPFETLLLPKFGASVFADVDGARALSLAEVLKELLGKYDRLFGVSFPYSMGWHAALEDRSTSARLHAHFYPPLLRSASVKKHMVGFEMLGEPQRDLTPEQAAERLRGA